MKDFPELQKGKFIAKECDITKESSVAEAFDFIKSTLKTVHVLINNAGVIKVKKVEGYLHLPNIKL